MTPQIMQSARERIAQQTAEYLASGREIQQIPAGWEPKPVEPESNWISTMDACRLIGVSYAKLLGWRATNASCPRNRKIGNNVDWYLPAVIAFSETYQGKRSGRKAA